MAFEASIPELRKLPAFRKVLLWAYDLTIAKWVELQATQNALNVWLAGGAGDPTEMKLDTLAVHTFAVSGSSMVYDPVAVDVDTYRAYGLWVQNITNTNPIAQVGQRQYHLAGAAGVSSLSPLYSLPASSVPAQFFVSPAPFFWVFDEPNFATQHTFGSIEAGLKLANPNPTQDCTVTYVGVRF